MSTHWLGLIGAVCLTLFIGELLRRGILREKFAVLWLLVAGAALVVAIYPPLLDRLASLLGFAVPANLLFLVSVGLLLAVSVQLSFEVSRLERNLSRLAEEHVLLVQRVEVLTEASQEPPAD
ncbi:MAG: DUF2304 domain-containing protein [Candidatus Nanopelagicales bacterium]